MFVFLLFNELNKCIKAYVKKWGVEAIPLKDASTDGNSRGGKVISNDGSLKVFIKIRCQSLYIKWYMMMTENLFDEIVVHFSESIF